MKNKKILFVILIFIIIASSVFGYLFFIKSNSNFYSTANIENNIKNNDILTPQSTPTLRVVYPNGGESLVEGKTYKIQWKSDNLQNGVTKLFLSVKNKGFEGRSFRDITTLNIIDNQPDYYDWAVPKALGAERDKFLIVVQYESSIQDYSDYPFSIVENTTPCRGADGKDYPKYYQCVDSKTCQAKSYCDPSPALGCVLQTCVNGQWSLDDDTKCLLRKNSNTWQLAISGVTYPECP